MQAVKCLSSHSTELIPWGTRSLALEALGSPTLQHQGLRVARLCARADKGGECVAVGPTATQPLETGAEQEG